MEGRATSETAGAPGMRDRHKTRPARHKPPILGHFSCAGRILSRSGRHQATQGELIRALDTVTLKPMTALRPLMQVNMKPQSPLRTPEQQPLKPTTPLQPKNTTKTPISHPQRRHRFQLAHLAGPQRRWRFQPHARTSEQRRCRFQTTAPPSATCPLLRKLARNSINPAPQQHSETLKYQRTQFKF